MSEREASPNPAPRKRVERTVEPEPVTEEKRKVDWERAREHVATELEKAGHGAAATHVRSMEWEG